MKKLLVTACLALLGASTFAQTSKGTMVISGAINISSENYESQRTNTLKSVGNRTSFRIAPGFGKFYRDGLEVGISTGFYFGKSTSEYMDSESTSREYSFDIGPYVRKFYPIADKLSFTADAGLGIGLGKSEDDYPDAVGSKNNNIFTYSAGASPGLTYFATEKLGFSLNVGRVFFNRSVTSNSDSESKYIKTDMGASISLSNSYIGLRYFINR
jgi:hypothetical protein